MKAKKRLTKRDVDAARYQGGTDIRWCGEMPSFGMRIYPPNEDGVSRKAFILSYRIKGRRRKGVLGRYGDMTIEEARKKARRWLGDVEKGIDPIEDRKRQKHKGTFGELQTAYIENHAKKHKKTWGEDEKRLNRHIPKSWKSRPVEGITTEEIAKLHSDIGTKKPYEANRLLALLRVMFKLAKGWGYLDGDNPAAGITKFREKKRSRYVTPQELPALAKAIDAEPNIYIRSALWLYMLTGARKSELLNAKWDDVNWTNARLRLPDTKSGEPQSLILSKQAVAILQAVPPIEKNPYIFPGKRKGQPLVNIGKPWRRIRKVAGLEDVRLHDLRRTVGAWLTGAGVDLNRIKDALRHQEIATTLIYARLYDGATAEPMEDHGKRVMEVAKRNKIVDVEERRKA